jgi:hypothetical protein
MQKGCGPRIAESKLHLDGQGFFMTTGNERSSPSRPPQGAVAHLISRDLIRWDLLPPVFASPELEGLEPEVPDIFVLGGRHYLMFNCEGSIYYTIADQRDVPYRPFGGGRLADSTILAPSHGRTSFSYVGRTVP